MRLPRIEVHDLDDDQRELGDALDTRPEVRAMGFVGPFGVWMHAPRVGQAMARLGREVRFGSTLSANVTEVAICTTGAHHRAAFEFAAHRPMAVAAGVDEDALDRLAAGEDPGFVDEEAAAHGVAAALLRNGRIPADVYDDAVRRLGDRGVVELVTTVGYYTLISFLLNGFEIPLEDGMEHPFDG